MRYLHIIKKKVLISLIAFSGNAHGIVCDRSFSVPKYNVLDGNSYGNAW